MGLHQELAAPPPATIVLPPAVAAGGNAERATSEDSKAMQPSDVKQKTERRNRVYNRRFRYEQLPSRRFFASMKKACVHARSNGGADWNAYPTQDDSSKLTRARMTMTAGMSSAASARFELGVNSDTREFEVSEKEGESLEISSADAFEIIECFWRKLLASMT